MCLLIWHIAKDTSYLVIPTKSTQSKSNQEETVDKPKLRNSLQTNCPMSFKKCLCHKTKIKVEEQFQNKKDLRDMKMEHKV